ncbi:ADP-heptose synthase [Paenibacillus donghaensis]|uniref:ADP-heptose synthase n=1 Tax=Paenibacillus donghaensis TaxID=414771 RepID=A0A2Z2K9H3_9BACL|nr:ADP-heptose synthase [Paenibacillus donghaensis]ASA22124.1 ADP-heptose synthase [Paenibacillus donghaensis]
MSRQFVTEAIMMVIYGELLAPGNPVEYIIPYISVMELYEVADSAEPVMNDPEEDKYIRPKIRELISYFEEPLNAKKIDRCLAVPWAKSSGILLGSQVQIKIINSIDTAPYGETFDRIETEMLLISQREKVPILTDQSELIRRIFEGSVPVQVYDVDDFEYAMEEKSRNPI